MRSSLKLTLLLLALFESAFATAANPEPVRDKWAVLVGVDNYQHAVKLNYCGADVRGLQEVLVKTGFPERQIALLTDQATDIKLVPIKSSIAQQIERIAGYAEPGDLLLIALSGHGIRHDGKNYFLPVDAQFGQIDSMIELDWVYDQLEKSKADLKVVLIDACRNDLRPKGTRGLTPDEQRTNAKDFVITSQRVPKGIMLIHSCSAGELSQEDPGLKHGVFMNFVLEGLRGKADLNDNKTVTLDELTKYAGKETKLFVEQRYNESQRPSVKGEFELEANDFPIATLGTSGSSNQFEQKHGPSLSLDDAQSQIAQSPHTSVEVSIVESPRTEPVTMPEIHSWESERASKSRVTMPNQPLSYYIWLLWVTWIRSCNLENLMAHLCLGLVTLLGIASLRFSKPFFKRQSLLLLVPFVMPFLMVMIGVLFRWEIVYAGTEAINNRMSCLVLIWRLHWILAIAFVWWFKGCRFPTACFLLCSICASWHAFAVAEMSITNNWSWFLLDF